MGVKVLDSLDAAHLCQSLLKFFDRIVVLFGGILCCTAHEVALEVVVVDLACLGDQLLEQGVLVRGHLSSAKASC